MRRRHGWVRNLLVASLAGAIALFPYAGGRRVPLLQFVDFAFHETGHLIASWMPELAMFLAGSLAEVGVPVGLATYFALSQRDLAASGMCFAWAGAAAWSVSVYAGDAVAQSLPIVGGEHDWAYILGPNGFDALAATRTVARAIEVGGLTVAALGVVMAVWATVAAVKPATTPVRKHVPHRTSGAGAPQRAAAGDPWSAASRQSGEAA